MINVDSNSLYRIDLSAADQPGTARLDSVSLPLAPSRKVEVRTNRPLAKSRATVQASVESLPPASQLVAQEELNAFRRLQDAKDKVERFHKATSDRVKRRKEDERNRQREELLAKAKRLNGVRAYCVANRVGACLEEEKQPEKPSTLRELDVATYEIREEAEDLSREEDLLIGDSGDEEREGSPQGLRAFSQAEYSAQEELPAKRTFKADFAAFSLGKSQSPKPQVDTQTPKLGKPLNVPQKSVTFTPLKATIPEKAEPTRSVPALPKGKVILPPQPPELTKPRKLTRAEETALANRLMRTGKRSKSESQSQIYESEEPLPTPAAIVVYNTDKALEALGNHSKGYRPTEEQVIQRQTKATAKLHLTGLRSGLPRKWGQNEFDDLALQIAMVREIAAIQEASVTRPRPKSAEPKVPWGTPAVPVDANRVKRVRVEALTLERGSVAQRRKSPHSPVQAYPRPLTAAEAQPRRSPERSKSAGKRDASPSSPFALTPRKGATLDTIEAAFKRKFKSAMRLVKHLPADQKKSRMKDLREQYESALADAKAKYLASLPPKTLGERHIDLVRYSAALKALVKERLKERYTEDIPAVCTCGALSTKRDPRKPVQCANNCPFYQRQQDYQKAVAEVLHTFNAV